MQIHCDVMSRSRVRDITLMLGLRRRKMNDGGSDQNGDVARLFFDSFSKRVGFVEDGVKNMTSEINKLKISMDRSQLSDLVLLERLQKAEVLVRESLNWTKEAAGIWRELREMPVTKEERSVVTSESWAGPRGVGGGGGGGRRRVRGPLPGLGDPLT